MAQYLLSVHSVEGEVSALMTVDQVPQSYKHTGTLEDEIESAGAWAFSGRLHGSPPRLGYRTKPESTSTLPPWSTSLPSPTNGVVLFDRHG